MFYVLSVNLYNVHVSGSCGLFMFQGRVAYVMSVNLYNDTVSGPCGLCGPGGMDSE